MATHSPIIPPTSLGEALRPLGDLSASEFSTLIAAVSGPRSFSLSKDELEVLRSRIPALAPNLPFVLGALSFLYSQMVRVVETGLLFDDAVRATVDELDKEADWGPKKDDVTKKLISILQPTETHQRFRKIQRLQAGSIPNAISFGTFVDLRPDFGEGDELSLKGYLAIVQFRINTDANSPEAKRFVVQLSEDSLLELKKAVQRAEDKIAALKKQSALALQLIKI